MVAIMEAACFDDSTILLSPASCVKAHTLIGDYVHSDDPYATSEACCGGKHKEETKVVKCELIGYDSLPNYLKHNEFILNYYRSDWPWKQTILSIFSVHNETINVWTHLIGFFIFLILTVGTAAVIPRSSFEQIYNQISVDRVANVSELCVKGPEWNGSSSYSLHGATLPSLASWYVQESQVNETATGLLTEAFGGNGADRSNREGEERAVTSEEETVARWPFMAFMTGAMVCLLTSSACHLLSCHSECCNYVMLRLDYAGISALIVTSFYPLVYYPFLCHPFYQIIYLSSITLFGLAAALVSLLPAFEAPEFRFARAGLFACMSLCSIVPIMHKLAIYGDRPEAVLAAGYEAVMGLFYAAGVVIYATRVPERWLPGKFDLAGHSHQLFHVLVIAGAYMHYLAGLVYLEWRDVDRCI